MSVSSDLEIWFINGAVSFFYQLLASVVIKIKLISANKNLSGCRLSIHNDNVDNVNKFITKIIKG